jgi:signal peptidase I
MKWECIYCDKEFSSKEIADKHELRCNEKPKIKNVKMKFTKPTKISGIIWIISVLSFIAFMAVFITVPFLSPEKSPLMPILLVISVLTGIIAYAVMVLSVAKNLSYGTHSHDTSFKKFVRFIFSLVFLPFAVMRSFVGVLFGIFVLLPVWGVGVLLLLLFFGVINSSTPIIGNSMNPTIRDQENIRLTSYSFIYKIFQPPKKGDIITFSSGRTANPNGEISSYIKRIVAVGGDEVIIKDGFLYVNNELVKEPYTAKARSTFGGSFLPDCKNIKIPNGYLFTLGDNRKRSKDSRDIGLVSINEIESILPVSKQTQFKDRSRDASSDGTNQGLPSFDLKDYYERINKIRIDNKLKPLKQNEKLEKAAIARAKSIIENNEVNNIGTGENGKYPYNKAIKESGYSNITIGEIRTTGYFDSEELSNYWLDYSTKESLLNKQFQDTGIGAFVGKIDGCEVQVIVQEFGGYAPPNYNKSNTEGWKSTLTRLREIQPSWQKCKEWGAAYERNKSDCDRINEIINIRIANIQTAVTKMEKNQWLSASESKGLDRDQDLYNEQEKLANKLNNL